MAEHSFWTWAHFLCKWTYLFLYLLSPSNSIFIAETVFLIFCTFNLLYNTLSFTLLHEPIFIPREGSARRTCRAGRVCTSKYSKTANPRPQPRGGAPPAGPRPSPDDRGELRLFSFRETFAHFPQSRRPESLGVSPTIDLQGRASPALEIMLAISRDLPPPLAL